MEEQMFSVFDYGIDRSVMYLGLVRVSFCRPYYCRRYICTVFLPFFLGIYGIF